MLSILRASEPLRDLGGGVQRVAKVVHGHNSASYRLVVTRAEIPPHLTQTTQN